MEDAAVNWLEYFLSIKSVCPWSWAAAKRDRIDIQQWKQGIKPLGEYEARIYTAPAHKPRQLKKISNTLNQTRPNEEWLWSHPKYQHNSTPIPVLIQQDRSRLEQIRQNLQKQS